MKTDSTLFESHSIRRIYDEELGIWWFSVVDIVQVLTQQPDYQAARNYWKVLKNRISKEGSQLVPNCNQLKMLADDGKQRLTEIKKQLRGAVISQKKARAELEKTGRKVITQDNYLPQAKRVSNSKKVSRDSDDE